MPQRTSRYPMRPPRPRMTDINRTWIPTIIDATGTADAPVDDAIGSNGAGTRTAHMDLGMLLDRKIAAPDTPRPADIAIQLFGVSLDLDIPRATHGQIQLTGIQPDGDGATAGIAHPHRRALEHIIGTDTTRTRIRHLG